MHMQLIDYAIAGVTLGFVSGVNWLFALPFLLYAVKMPRRISGM